MMRDQKAVVRHNAALLTRRSGGAILQGIPTPTLANFDSRLVTNNNQQIKHNKDTNDRQ
jgi:hypothetical protein